MSVYPKKLRYLRTGHGYFRLTLRRKTEHWQCGGKNVWHYILCIISQRFSFYRFVGEECLMSKLLFWANIIKEEKTETAEVCDCSRRIFFWVSALQSTSYAFLLQENLALVFSLRVTHFVFLDWGTAICRGCFCASNSSRLTYTKHNLYTSFMIASRKVVCYYFAENSCTLEQHGFCHCFPRFIWNISFETE